MRCRKNVTTLLNNNPEGLAGGGVGARWTVAPLLIYFISLSCLQGFRLTFVLDAKGFAWWHLSSVVTGVSAVCNALLFLAVTSALARREFLSRRRPLWAKNDRRDGKEQVRGSKRLNCDFILTTPVWAPLQNLN